MRGYLLNNILRSVLDPSYMLGRFQYFINQTNIKATYQKIHFWKRCLLKGYAILFFFLNTDKKMQPVSQGILPFVLYILPWSSRNHSVMLICCSIHIYYYLISVENIFIRLQKYCVILRDFALACETFVSSPKILCSPKKLCFLAEVLFSLETLLSLAKVLCARRSIVLLRNAAYS